MINSKQSFTVLFALLLLLTTSTLFAHEGHGVPGSVPPAPHGGKLKEATGGGKELFFEAVYNDGQLSLYPLHITNDNSFAAVSPKGQLTNVSVSVELPRSKKVQKLETKNDEEAIQAGFDVKGASRFIVLVSAKYAGTVKKAKIQIEK